MKKTSTICAVALLALSAVPAEAFTRRERGSGDPALIKEMYRDGVKPQRKADSVSATRSDSQTITYGYCGNPHMTFGTAWQEYTALVEFPEDFVRRFDGAEVIGVQIASPDNFEDPTLNNFTSFDLCFYRDLGEVPFYTQPATLGSKAYEWNDISLQSAVKIEAGKPFYVGYSGLAPSIDDSCFAVDFIANSDDKGLILGWTDEESGEEIWEPYTEWYGNLCLKLVIRASKLPSDEINLEHVYLPGYVNTGVPFGLTLVVTNTAYNYIDSFTFDYTIGDTTNTIPVTLDSPLAPLQTWEARVEGLVCDEIGVQVPVDYAITSVNGKEDAFITDSSDHDTWFLSLPEGVGYERNVVVEEGTGTWCGYCPLGIVAMKYMEETYTDGSFIPIAVHYNDVMESPSYVELAEEYYPGYPAALINRDMYRLGVILEPETYLLEGAYLFTRDIPAYADISLGSCNVDEAGSLLNLETVSRFAIDSDASYRVEIALTESNVGPYPQTNFFANNAEGPMGGFENLPDPVLLTYNDVARGLHIAGEIPSGVTAGEEYAVSYSLPIDGIENTENCKLIVMLVNTNNGEIENAHSFRLDTLVSGVSEVCASGVRIYAEDGGIVVDGVSGKTIVYGIDGSLQATLDGSGKANVAPGAYIVVSGDTSIKVVVNK